MIAVRLIRKVQGNSNRFYVHRDVTLGSRPHIGESITSDIYGRSVKVVDIQQVANTEVMYVFLDPDYRLYKHPEKLNEIAAGYEARGWDRTKDHADVKEVAP